MEKDFIVINSIRFDENVIIRKHYDFIIIGDRFFRIKLNYSYTNWFNKKPYQLTKTKNMLRYYYYEKK